MHKFLMKMEAVDAKSSKLKDETPVMNDLARVLQKTRNRVEEVLKKENKWLSVLK